MGWADSPLLESSVGDWCLGSFPLLVEPIGSEVLFFWSSMTKVTTLVLRTQLSVVDPALRQTIAAKLNLCFGNYRAIFSSMLAICTLTSLLLEED